MTKIFNSTALAATFAAAALAGLVMASGESQASASASIFKCRAGSMDKVVKCCEQIVERKGKPLWMVEANLSCQSAAVCSKGGKSSQPLTYAAYVKPKKCGFKLPDGNQGSGSTIPGSKLPNGPITYDKP